MHIDTSYRAMTGNYTRGGNSCEYIVIHNTGNNASANSEARYAANDRHDSSYHYVLDDSECYQLLNDTDTAWAVGAWSGCTPYVRNNQSISIEVCSNGDEFSASEQTQLRELVGILMERHGIDASHVVRHWDCHSGRKSCPAYYAGKSNSAWDDLHAYITSGIDDYPTGWQTSDDGRMWYSWGRDSYPSNGWQQIDGMWYLFDVEGYLMTGWQAVNGSWYYLEQKHNGHYGEMLTGWVYVGDKWYYLDSDGRMQMSTCIKGANGWYVLGSDGAMLTGDIQTDGDGVLQM